MGSRKPGVEITADHMKASAVLLALLAACFTGCSHPKTDGEALFEERPSLTKATRVAMERGGFSLVVPAGWSFVSLGKRDGGDSERRSGGIKEAPAGAVFGPIGYLGAWVCTSPDASLNTHLREEVEYWKQMFGADRVRVLEQETFRSRVGVPILYAHLQIDHKTHTFFFFRNEASQTIHLGGFPDDEDRKIANSIRLTSPETSGRR